MTTTKTKKATGSKALSYVRNLPEVGGPVLDAVRKAEEIEVEIARLEATIKAKRADLARHCKATEERVATLGWTADEIAAAKGR